MPTKKEILKTMIDIEKEHHLLSGDAVWQDELFKLQPKLCDMMCDIANETGYPLAEELPYLFKLENK